MDALPLFPMLLIFMIVILAALGFALQWLAERQQESTLPPLALLSLRCPQCRLELNDGWSHCPICGSSFTAGATPIVPSRPVDEREVSLSRSVDILYLQALAQHPSLISSFERGNETAQ